MTLISVSRPNGGRPPSGRKPHPRGDERERFARARQAAEALFAPKRQDIEQSVADSLPPADPAARKPRGLGISLTGPVRHDAVEAPASPQQQMTPDIPASQFARIRALVTYGLTVSQVAEVYGVGVDEIARILRQA
jgi:hypothetical protein